jgi:hypothetical protein
MSFRQARSCMRTIAGTRGSGAQQQPEAVILYGGNAPACTPASNWVMPCQCPIRVQIST